MKRGRFVLTALSAGAVGTALATDACSSTIKQYVPQNGGLPPIGSTYVLNVEYAISNIGGKKLRGRTYNGSTVGPVLKTRPGETFAVRIVNKLPPNPPAHPIEGRTMIPVVHDVMQAMDSKYHGPVRPSDYISKDNNPHGYNTTNLHVHGLQTIPHLFNPVGTSDPAAMMIEIQPGQSFQYSFPIPADHPSGLFWYHPHKHGSTDVQVSNGMAGLIVVRGPIDEVPEIAAAREVFLTVQTLDVNKSKTLPGVYEREYIAYKTPAEGGYNFGTDFTMITSNGEGIYWVDNTTAPPAYKQVGLPEFNVQPGEVVRLRMLNGTNYLPLFLKLPGFAAWIVAFDGVNTLEASDLDMSGKGTTVITPANAFSAPALLAMSANRLEILLQAPKTPGKYVLSSVASEGIGFMPVPDLELLQFNVSGPEVSMKIPTKLPVPVREYPVITEKECVATRHFVFDEGVQTVLLTGFGFTINGKLYAMEQCPTQPKVGTCEEWILENATLEAHPFHLHENSFQLVEINDVPLKTMEVWDTFIIPPKMNHKYGKIKIRIRFKQWYGKTVFHCHILPHEDTGMMQNILLS